MARIHAHRKGKSGSTRPYLKTNPEWVAMEKAEIEETIVRLHQEGLSTASIGVRLRDAYGVPNVHLATGRSVTEILSSKGTKFTLPEDLASLIKRAASLQTHLKDHRKDLSNRRGLELIESRIRRLSRYYKSRGVLPADWDFSLKLAELQVKWVAHGQGPGRSGARGPARSGTEGRGSRRRRGPGPHLLPLRSGRHDLRLDPGAGLDAPRQANPRLHGARARSDVRGPPPRGIERALDRERHGIRSTRSPRRPSVSGRRPRPPQAAPRLRQGRPRESPLLRRRRGAGNVRRDDDVAFRPRPRRAELGSGRAGNGRRDRGQAGAWGVRRRECRALR